MQLSQAQQNTASLISIKHIQKLRPNFSQKVLKLDMNPVLQANTAVYEVWTSAAINET